MDGSPDWRPDGRRLAFASDRAGTFDLYTMGRYGGHVRRLTGGPAEDLLPAWSPDGRRIVFDRIRVNGNRDLFIVTVKHRKVRPVTNDPFSELAPSWQPIPR